MKLSQIATSALIACVSARFGEHDAMAAHGLFNLGLHVAINGYPNGDICTLKNVRIRKEWYVENHSFSNYQNNPVDIAESIKNLG